MARAVLLCCALLAVAVFGVSAQTSAAVSIHDKTFKVELSGKPALPDTCSKVCKETCKDDCKEQCNPKTVKKCKQVPHEVEVCKDVVVTKKVKECKNTCDNGDSPTKVTTVSVKASGEHAHMKEVTISADSEKKSGRKLFSTLTKGISKLISGGSVTLPHPTAALGVEKCVEICEDVDKDKVEEKCETKTETEEECKEVTEKNCKEVCKPYCNQECTIKCEPQSKIAAAVSAPGEIAHTLSKAAKAIAGH